MPFIYIFEEDMGRDSRFAKVRVPIDIGLDFESRRQTLRRLLCGVPARIFPRQPASYPLCLEPADVLEISIPRSSSETDELIDNDH